MVRLLLVVLVLLAALLGPAAPVAAGAEWCDTDPLVLVQAPDGTVITVYLLVGALGAEHLPAALAASLVAASEPVALAGGGRALRVTITVLVPDDLFARGFPARAAAHSGPLGTGVLHDATAGTSGAALTLRFTLRLP